MWLLKTDCTELKFFVGPESVPGGYAILSHVWGEHEASFQDLQRLTRRCIGTGEDPRELVQDKIRETCLLAERHGLQWVWIDTCCIDKTSSAELSEAINSMFLFYSMSEVCYAFLRDVPADCVLDKVGSEFRRSRWHERGWTLQELVAPKLVLFISEAWTTLGTKAEFAELLEEITHVPTRILRLEEDLADISVAGRMSWASRRQTTRIEDEAYSLLGIFGISMPTLYGEGRKAFYRLQEEIMRTYADWSLFMWGSMRTLNYMRRRSQIDGWRHSSRCEAHLSADSCLMASKPSVFSSGIHTVSDHLRNSATTVGL